MVEYSVDTNPRLKVYFGAAIVSALLAWGLSTVSFLSPYRFAAPSAFVIFGGLLWAFDRFLWRCPGIHALSGIPYFGGAWEGTLKRTNMVDDPSPEVHQVSCVITQTWRKIDFVFEGETTVSSTRIVGLFVENPQNVVVRYIYTSRPKTVVDAKSQGGDGVTELRLVKRNDGDYLEGIYYSDKPRRGDVQLRRLARGQSPKPNKPLQPPSGGAGAP